MRKMVSVITPCLNGEQFVERYFDSILKQTYKNIELIFINDGSTDRTEKIALSYKKRFEESGLSFIYIYQKNAGLAAALNAGLKIFTGEYLTWPDSDDFLSEDSIEKKVRFLQENQEYGLVRSDAYVFDEKDLSVPVGFISEKNPRRFNEHIFNNLIYEKDIYFCCGCYMVRRSAFLTANPKREIYVSRGGQNYQMLLPVSYQYKCGYIDEPLYNYIKRNNSLSHSLQTLEDNLRRCDEHEDILKNTINAMDIDTKYYRQIITEKYERKRFYLACSYRDKVLLKKQYRLLKNKCQLTIEDKITYIRGLFYPIDLTYRAINKFRRCVIK